MLLFGFVFVIVVVFVGCMLIDWVFVVMFVLVMVVFVSFVVLIMCEMCGLELCDFGWVMRFEFGVVVFGGGVGEFFFW